MAIWHSLLLLFQDKSHANQGGPTQRASALAALSSAFNPSSERSTSPVNNLPWRNILVNSCSFLCFTVYSHSKIASMMIVSMCKTFINFSNYWHGDCILCHCSPMIGQMVQIKRGQLKELRLWLPYPLHLNHRQEIKLPLQRPLAQVKDHKELRQ